MLWYTCFQLEFFVPHGTACSPPQILRTGQRKGGKTLKLPVKRIISYTCFALLAIAIIFLLIRLILNPSGLTTALAGMLGSLKPIVVGCVMAYLLFPLTRFAEQFLLFRNVSKKAARTLSTFFAVAVVLVLLFLFGYVISPQLVFNLPSLVQSIPNMIQQTADQLREALTAHGQSTEIVDTISDKITAYLETWLQDDPLSAILDVAGRVVSAAKNVLNFIIGIIVMAYLLMSRDEFIGQGKKLLFAVFRKRSVCNRILTHLRVINQIFSGFVSGKLLDSLIIGIICGVCLSILHIPYALLISVIVGITNIVPVFGPFFGAIPSAFLLVLTDPGKCLIFIIFIVILQQVDGNIIGPRILGDSTGLSAFWVLFALLLFNHLMGFWGMLLGVPLFASFSYLLGEFVNRRLKKQNLPEETENYVDIAAIDEAGNISRVEPKSIEFTPFIHGTDSVVSRVTDLLKNPAGLLERKSAPPEEEAPEDKDPPGGDSPR